MSRHGRAATWILGLVLVVQSAVVHGTVLAQDTTSTDVPVAPRNELTPASLQKRIAAVRDNADLDEAVRTQIVESLQSAVKSLEDADRFEATLNGLETQVSKTPRRLAEIERELKEPPRELTEPGRNVSLDELQTQLAEAQAGVATADQRLAALEAELDRRAKRRTEAPARLATARQQLDEVQNQLAIPVPESTPTADAARLALLAKQKSLSRELRLLEREVAAYDATSRLLVAERDLATRESATAQKHVTSLQKWVNDRRRLEARENAREATALAKSVHEDVQPLAEEVARLAAALVDSRSRIATEITDTTASIRQLERRTEQLVSEFEGLTERADRAGFTNALGVLLREHRSALPDVRTLRSEIDARQEQMSELHLDRIEFEKQRRSGIDLQTIVEETADALVPDDDPERERIEEDVRSVLSARRRFLASAIEDANTLLDRLSTLDTDERVLVQRVAEQNAYISEHILWVRSAPPLGPTEIDSARDAIAWLVRGLRTLGEVIAADVIANGVLYVIATLLFVCLLPWQQRFRARLRAAGELASKRTTTDMQPTMVALLFTLVVAAFWPLAAGLVGWRIWELGDSSVFCRAFGRAMVSTAVLCFGLDVFRKTCRPNGLGRSHFGWPERASSMVRSSLGFVVLFALPFAFVALLFQQASIQPFINSVGRVALVVALLVTAMAAHQLLRPSGDVIEFSIGADHSNWLARTRYVWYPLGVGIPVALSVLSLFGYHYTASHLAYRLVATIAFVLVVLLIDAFFKRWLLLAHRRMAIRRAREKREAAIAEARAKQAEGEAMIPGEDLSAVLEDPAISLAASNAQIRVLFQAVFTVLSLVGVWWIWAAVLPAFGVLDRIRLWQSAYTGGVVDGVEIVNWVTLGSVLLAVGIAIVTVVAAKNLPGLLGFTVLSRLPLDAGSRYAWSAVCGYAITVTGAIAVFRVLGVSWESVQWLVAAMTVGLGFGLQEIFANFVSGLIILFERPIRVGDTVTVGTVTGTVARIRIRATTIIDWDRKELIVPNREFVTGQLVNWTLSDPVLRVVCRVGVAYGSDTRLARKLLLQIAREHPQILDEPPPNVIFWEFGDSTLNLELRIFVSSIHLFRMIKDDVNTAIDEAFAAHDIEIAFPQRDLHVRSVDGAIPLSNVPHAPLDSGSGSLQDRAEAAAEGQ